MFLNHDKCVYFRAHAYTKSIGVKRESFAISLVFYMELIDFPSFLTLPFGHSSLLALEYSRFLASRFLVPPPNVS